MRTFLKLFIVLFIAVSVFESACTKYPDGPKISLLSRKSRLINTWKVEKADINGTDVTSLYSGFIMDIKKDGTYAATTGTFTDTGKWELGEDADDMYTTSDTPGSLEQAHRLLRLKSKELWTRITAPNGEKTIIHYVPN
jgi:hypothetical protein